MTAPSATESLFEPVRRVELADRGEAYPLAGSLVQLAHAQRPPRGVRQPRPSSRPIYLRKPDAEINWTTRDGAHR